jgi:hypothetical protein
MKEVELRPSAYHRNSDLKVGRDTFRRNVYFNVGKAKNCIMRSFITCPLLQV